MYKEFQLKQPLCCLNLWFKSVGWIRWICVLSDESWESEFPPKQSSGVTARDLIKAKWVLMVFYYPRHPNTSWGGVLGMFSGSKYLLRRWPWMSRAKYLLLIVVALKAVARLPIIDDPNAWACLQRNSLRQPAWQCGLKEFYFGHMQVGSQKVIEWNNMMRSGLGYSDTGLLV